jgi:hypothetical protein
VEYDDDRSALDAICSGIPAEMVPILVAKASAKEASGLGGHQDLPHRRRPRAEGNGAKPPSRVRGDRSP